MNDRQSQISPNKWTLEGSVQGWVIYQDKRVSEPQLIIERVPSGGVTLWALLS